MKYTKDDRLDIARQVYDGEMTMIVAAERYDVDISSIKRYVRQYRETKGLPCRIKREGVQSHPKKRLDDSSMEDIKSMTREELIDALVMARINEARLKKGYEVKGDGTVILYDSKNTK